MQTQDHYKGWVEDDPNPLSRDHKIVPLDSKYTADLEDSSIPQDRQIYLDAETTLEAMSRIFYLPASCTGCGQMTGGNDDRAMLLIKAGGVCEPVRAFHLRCFGELDQFRPPENESREDKIWRLRSQGLTETEIATEIGTSQPTVSRLLSKSRRKPNSTTIN